MRESHEADGRHVSAGARLQDHQQGDRGESATYSHWLIHWFIHWRRFHPECLLLTETLWNDECCCNVVDYCCRRLLSFQLTVWRTQRHCCFCGFIIQSSRLHVTITHSSHDGFSQTFSTTVTGIIRDQLRTRERNPQQQLTICWHLFMCHRKHWEWNASHFFLLSPDIDDVSTCWSPVRDPPLWVSEGDIRTDTMGWDMIELNACFYGLVTFECSYLLSHDCNWDTD